MKSLEAAKSEVSEFREIQPFSHFTKDYKKPRDLFNTHMHELAENTDKLNSAEGMLGKAVSVVMENDRGKRSYKINYKSPDGKSYAHEIAYKYGITFEQLMDNRP